MVGIHQVKLNCSATSSHYLSMHYSQRNCNLLYEGDCVFIHHSVIFSSLETNWSNTRLPLISPRCESVEAIWEWYPNLPCLGLFLHLLCLKASSQQDSSVLISALLSLLEHIQSVDLFALCLIYAFFHAHVMLHLCFHSILSSHRLENYIGKNNTCDLWECWVRLQGDALKGSCAIVWPFKPSSIRLFAQIHLPSPLSIAMDAIQRYTLQEFSDYGQITKDKIFLLFCACKPRENQRNHNSWPKGKSEREVIFMEWRNLLNLTLWWGFICNCRNDDVSEAVVGAVTQGGDDCPPLIPFNGAAAASPIDLQFTLASFAACIIAHWCHHVLFYVNYPLSVCFWVGQLLCQSWLLHSAHFFGCSFWRWLSFGSIIPAARESALVRKWVPSSFIIGSIACNSLHVLTLRSCCQLLITFKFICGTFGAIILSWFS